VAQKLGSEEFEEGFDLVHWRLLLLALAQNSPNTA
jgi:hypothetical protein